MRSFLMAMLLVGCATSYHPRNYNGGYYEGHDLNTLSQSNEVSVGFEGNAYTSFEQVQVMAWRRAEEACHEKHFANSQRVGQENILDPSALGHNVVLVRARCY